MSTVVACPSVISSAMSLPRDGAVHEAVAAEARDDVEPVYLGHRAQDAGLVWRHLVEPGPPAHQRRVGQRGRPPHRPLDERLPEAPVRLRLERRAFVTAPDAEQEARALAPQRDALMRIDDEGRGLGDALEGKWAVMNFERRSGLTGTSMPASRPTPPDQAPAARTMTGGVHRARARRHALDGARAAAAHGRHLALRAALLRRARRARAAIAAATRDAVSAAVAPRVRRRQGRSPARRYGNLRPVSSATGAPRPRPGSAAAPRSSRASATSSGIGR